jgi:hypothetical protein
MPVASSFSEIIVSGDGTVGDTPEQWSFGSVMYVTLFKLQSTRSRPAK